MVFAKDPLIADQHLKVTKEASGHVIYAAPGAAVAVNGQQVGSAQLREGDVITLGGTSLRFELRGE